MQGHRRMLIGETFAGEGAGEGADVVADIPAATHAQANPFFTPA
jgi:hypothetical protein